MTCRECDKDHQVPDGFTSRYGLTPETVLSLRLVHDASRSRTVAYLVRPGTEEPVMELGWITDMVPEEGKRLWLRDLIAPVPKAEERWCHCD